MLKASVVNSMYTNCSERYDDVRTKTSFSREKKKKKQIEAAAIIDMSY